MIKCAVLENLQMTYCYRCIMNLIEIHQTLSSINDYY